ncbi:Cl- channel, voltage-gated family protein [Treponema primitia ZAS-2]|uniref:Cl-channel, voltage-gated family protein n=1 Tax=Treponema primitia (strain ATCC BAA-887 / DSM 12427 / ZAS-2) TaxID=545694 RepID=F5YP18_TREPZ|nr:ClC family H(+)/Cl(-) exchange transporter [Treponema primitia]AEF85841.1 Cl- channel, voltage-gated family protein [Treponema primitia ZAS-2]
MSKTNIPITKTIRHIYNSRLAVVLESVVIGFAVGFVVVLFRRLLTGADALRRWMYATLLPGKPWYWMAGLVFALALIGLFLGWAAKVRPMIRGSGIPQVKGALHRQLSLNWAPELPLKLITGVLGLGAGLSLGREGPSIQIGAYVGMGILTLLRRPYGERKFLVTAASAAGIAAAFNAPLAGVLFVLEELQASFSPLLLACAMGAAMAADTVAGYFFGMGPVFDFRQIRILPIHSFLWVALLGVICALLGEFFKRTLYGSLDLYERLKIPQLFRPIIPLLVSIPLGFFLFDVSGGGHGLIESLSEPGRSIELLAVLLLGKILFTVFSFGSGTSGGIFLPILACGALTGRILGDLLFAAGFISETQILNLMILGMAAFFTAVVKAPVTGIVLILEMSGNFSHMTTLVLVSLTSLVTTDLLASRPVYGVLLDRILRNKKAKEATDTGIGTSIAASTDTSAGAPGDKLG